MKVYTADVVVERLEGKSFIMNSWRVLPSGLLVKDGVVVEDENSVKEFIEVVNKIVEMVREKYNV